MSLGQSAELALRRWKASKDCGALPLHANHHVFSREFQAAVGPAKDRVQIVEIDAVRTVDDQLWCLYCCCQPQSRDYAITRSRRKARV